jgi:hypothetical protein
MGWGECVKAKWKKKNLKQSYVEYLYHKLQVELDLCLLFSFVCIVTRCFECMVVIVVGTLDHNYV